RAFALDEAALTGMYNGQPTLGRSALSGILSDGSSTLQRSQLLGYMDDGTPTLEREMTTAELLGYLNGSPTLARELGMGEMMGFHNGVPILARKLGMGALRIDPGTLDLNRDTLRHYTDVEFPHRAAMDQRVISRLEQDTG